MWKGSPKGKAKRGQYLPALERERTIFASYEYGVRKSLTKFGKKKNVNSRISLAMILWFLFDFFSFVLRNILMNFDSFIFY